MLSDDFTETLYLEIIISFLKTANIPFLSQKWVIISWFLRYLNFFRAWWHLFLYLFHFYAVNPKSSLTDFMESRWLAFLFYSHRLLRIFNDCCSAFPVWVTLMSSSQCIHFFFLLPTDDVWLLRSIIHLPQGFSVGVASDLWSHLHILYHYPCL